MPLFCLFTVGRHGNFTAGVTMEHPDLLCTALALTIELLSIIVCAVLETSYKNSCLSPTHHGLLLYVPISRVGTTNINNRPLLLNTYCLSRF
jgi:D-tyrosyl-tRNA(Tyr) deacylase